VTGRDLILSSQPREQHPSIVRDRWTPRLVAAFLADAAEAYRYPNQLNVPREAGSQIQKPLSWLCWLDDDIQKIAFDRACGVPWKAIAHARGINRSTAWRHWTCAMTAIAARLNAAGDATTLQHRETRPALPGRVD
jgi:hypothetical protein